MIFRQIIHDDLGCASYLIGDESAGIAAVVDPKLEIEEYLALARYMGVSIEHILETHNHADHVSGHGRLVAATGARIHIHRAAEAAYEHEPFEDGFELVLGSVRARALHTPGHRPEHTAFALFDGARDDEEPWALLSGDTLFVGDIARPDLAVEKEEGARGIFRSLSEKVLSLPAQTEVWPAHLGGSLCGGPSMDMKISTTIGFERANNELLAERDEERFIERALGALPPQPPNFQSIVDLNRGPLFTEGVDAHPLTPRQVSQRDRDGALVVDVRTALQFDEAHVPASVSIPAVGAGFGTRLAWIADRDQQVLFVGRDDEDGLRAARLAEAVGITKLAGYLAGGMTGWREEKCPTSRIDRIDVAALLERTSAEPGLQILDVRERAEWDRGHIPGSIHTPYHDLGSLPEIDPKRPVAVICSSGERSGIAASLLLRLGAERVLHVVDGGVGSWAERGGEIES